MFGKIGGFLKKNGLKLMGSALGGPIGVASQVASLVADAAGIDLDTDKEVDEAAIIERMKADPQILVELRKIEADNKVRLRELVIQAAQIDLEETKTHQLDRVSARDMRLDYIKTTGKDDWLMKVIAITVVVGFLGTVVLFLLGYTVPESTSVAILIGNLGGGFIQILAYLFGSSRGSKQKDTNSAISQLVKE